MSISLLRNYISLILQEDIKDQNNWRPAKDEDWINYYDKNKRNPKELPYLEPDGVSYADTGDSVPTHGGFSHFLKHVHEWDENIAAQAAQIVKEKFQDYIKETGYPVYLQSKQGSTREVNTLSDIPMGNFWIYLDYVNDKMYESGGYNSLSTFEKDVIDSMEIFYKKYEELAFDMLENSTDVSDKNYPDIYVLTNFLEGGPIIKYNETYKGRVRKCVMDLSNGFFVGFDSIKENAKLLTCYQMQPAYEKGIYKSLLLLSPLKRSAKRKKVNKKTKEVEHEVWSLIPNKAQLTDEYKNLAILATVANDKKWFITDAQAEEDKRNSGMESDFELSPETKEFIENKK